MTHKNKFNQPTYVWKRCSIFLVTTTSPPAALRYQVLPAKLWRTKKNKDMCVVTIGETVQLYESKVPDSMVLLLTVEICVLFPWSPLGWGLWLRPHLCAPQGCSVGTSWMNGSLDRHQGCQSVLSSNTLDMCSLFVNGVLLTYINSLVANYHQFNRLPTSRLTKLTRIQSK